MTVNVKIGACLLFDDSLGLLEPLNVDVGESELSAFLCKLLSEHSTEAGSRTSNEDMLSPDTLLRQPSLLLNKSIEPIQENNDVRDIPL